jgi:hypothetical protein
MYTISLAILTCFIIFNVECHSSLHPRSKVRSRFRRREFVQEEVRKNMLNYMTSIKGEITDIVLEEMIDYYNGQTSKLYHLEKELLHLKNSSVPMGNNSTRLNNFIVRLSKQQRAFALNISSMEYKINNLTNILSDLLNELQQQKPVQVVRRLVSPKKEIPIGKSTFFSVSLFPRFLIDCDDVLHQQPSLVHEGIFRIKPRFASESFDVLCIFENNTGEI